MRTHKPTPPPAKRGEAGRGAVLLGLLLLAGCVSKSEYRSFVVAARGFADSVGPVFSDYTLKDQALSEVSRKNRLAELRDFERALEAAEERAR